MQERQRQILTAIIQEFNETAEPVSSHVLVEKYRFGMSPATMRWEMMELAENDFLSQPHTSAGRVPTDKAYRFFIDEIMEEKPLCSSDKKRIEKEIFDLREKRLASRRLAETLALISKNFCVNKEEDDFYEAGLNWLLKEPEFFEREKMVGIVDCLEEMDSYFDELTREMENDFYIFVGAENRNKRLRDCSLVVKSVDSAPGEKKFIGVLGTRRMDYARNKALLNYAAEILQDNANR